MRGLRSTILLVALVAGIGAYAYFVTSKKPDPNAPPAKERVFKGVDADGITDLTVKAESGDTTTLKKENGVWKFSKLKFWPTYYTPFHEGWKGKQLSCINGNGTATSPGADMPSTDKAGVFPDVYFPPFHYPNPVTGKPVDVTALNARAVAETLEVVAAERAIVGLGVHGPSNLSRAPQVEGQWVFDRPLLRWNVENSPRVPVTLESGEAAALRLVRIDRKCLIVASAGMGGVMDAAAEGAGAPGVVDVEGQRRMHGNCRM